jgi:hypothetical protein
MKSFLVAFLVLSGCASYCAQSTNKDTVVCKAERSIETCGPKALGIFAQAMPFIIAGDYTAAIALVFEQAPDEAECINDVLDRTVANAHGYSSPEAHAFRFARERETVRRVALKAAAKK